MKKKLIRFTVGLVILSIGWMLFRASFIVGRVTDAEGNGKAYNGKAYYNYINYKGVANENDIVLTISPRNPFDLEPDSDLARFDIVLLHNTPMPQLVDVNKFTGIGIIY